MASLSLLVLFFLDFDITSNLVVLGLAVSLSTKLHYWPQYIHSTLSLHIIVTFQFVVLANLRGYHQEIRSSECNGKRSRAFNEQHCSCRRAHISRKTWK